MATRKRTVDDPFEVDSTPDEVDESEATEEDPRPNSEHLANMAIAKLDTASKRDGTSASMFTQAHVLAILAVAEAIREFTAAWPQE